MMHVKLMGYMGEIMNHRDMNLGPLKLLSGAIRTEISGVWSDLQFLTNK